MRAGCAPRPSPGPPRDPAAAAAMIRPLSAAGGSTTGTLGIQHRHDRRRAPRSRHARRRTSARCARTAVGLVGVQGAQHEGGGEIADLVAGQAGVARSGGASVRSVMSLAPPRTRRMASRPRRIRLLTVPSGVPVRCRDLELGQTRRSTRVRSPRAGRRTGPRARAARCRHPGSAETSPQTSGIWSWGGGTSSCSGSSVVGRRRRTASIARWWTIESSHVFTLPRPST